MAGYIGTRAAVASPGTERKKTFDITTTTTNLTGLSYTPGFVHVYHNGIRLVDSTDYTATDGSTITLNTAAENGDEVVVVSYGTFSPADTYTKSETYAKTEADDRYVNASGDTMTGNLAVPARGLSVGSREQFNLTNLGDETSIDWDNVTRNSIAYALGSGHSNAPMQGVNSLVVDLNTEGMGGTNNSGVDTRGAQLWFTDILGSQEGGQTGRFCVRMKQGATQHPWEKVLTTYSFRRNFARQSGTLLTSTSSYQDVTPTITVSPLSAASRFLIFARWGGYWQPSGDAKGCIVRNGTIILENSRVAGNTTTQHETCIEIWVDHPNTTSAVSYKLQGAVVTSGSGYMDFGHAGNLCSILIMEFEG